MDSCPHLPVELKLLVGGTLVYRGKRRRFKAGDIIIANYQLAELLLDQGKATRIWS